MNTVWILTYEVNEYDQCGEYFYDVFLHKPTYDELARALFGAHRSSVDPEVVEHVLAGGGRIGTEYKWWYLREVKL